MYYLKSRHAADPIKFTVDIESLLIMEDKFKLEPNKNWLMR